MNDQEKKQHEVDVTTEFIKSKFAMEKKAIEKILFETYYRDFKERIENGTDPRNLQEELLFKEVRSKVSGTRNLAIRGFWWFTFTINPSLFRDRSEYLSRLKKKVEKFVRKKCVKRAIWTFELTKEEVPHSHLLMELSDENPIARHTFEKGTLNTFKDVGYVKQKPAPQEWVADKVKYLLGEKWDEEKESMINNDRVWREKEGLDPFYTLGGWGDYLDAPPPASEG